MTPKKLVFFGGFGAAVNHHSVAASPGMMSSLAKVNKSLGAHFQTLFSKIVLFLMFLNIQIDLIILKTDDEHFTLTTKKIIAYHL